MAVFSSTRELDKQDQVRNYKGTTGLRKSIMKVASSKLNPLGYVAPVLTHGISTMAAQNDDKKAYNKNWAGAIGQQFSAIKAVGSVAGLVAGGGAAGASASAGTGAAASAGGGGLLSGNPLASKLNIGQGGGKEGRMARRNARKGGDSMFGDEGGNELTDDIASKNKGDVVDEMDENATEEGETKSGASKVEGAMEKLGEIAGVAKEVAGVATQKFATDRAIQDEKESMFMKKQQGTSVYAE